MITPAMITPPAPRRPDYDGAWIGGVVGGLLAADPPEWLPEPARAARRVVLLVIDGLGWQAVTTHGAILPTIAAMDGRAITAAAPTTTATCLTSITTGAVPADHGLLGYRIGYEGATLNVLRWTLDGDRARPPAPERVQPLPPFGGRDVPVLTDAAFARTGFTGAHLRGGDFQGWETVAVLVEHVRRTVAGDRRFAYAYYHGVDKVAHAHGLHDSFYPAELAAADALVATLLAVMPPDAALVVTADHGQAHVPPDRVRSLDALQPLLRTMAGESRWRTLYARRGAAADLAAAAQEQYGDVAWVFTRDQLFDEHWLGGPAPAAVRQRIGDVTLAPFADIAFDDPSYPRERELVGRHGSLTAAELEVPLLAAFGRA